MELMLPASSTQKGPMASSCKVRQAVGSMQQLCQTEQIQLQPKRLKEGLAAVLLHDCIIWQRQVLQHAHPRYSKQECRHSKYWTDHKVAPNTPLDIMWILNSIVAPVVLRLKSSQPSKQACPSNLQSQNKSMRGEQSRWELGSSSMLLLMYNSVIHFLFNF